MAQKKTVNVVEIEFKTKKEQLQKINEFLTDIKKNGKLNNADMRVFNSIIQQSTQLMGQLEEAIKEGSNASQLKAMRSTYSKIATQLSTMAGRELSLGKTTAQHAEELAKAQKEVDELTKAYEELRKKRDAALVGKDGSVKKENRDAVAKSAVKSSRKGRRGANSAGEQALLDSGGDISKLQKDAAAGSKAAAEALRIWEAEIQRLTTEYNNLQKEIIEARDAVNEQKAAVTKLKSAGGYDTDTVGQLNAYSGAMTTNANIMGDYAKRAEETTDGIVRQGEAFAKNDGLIKQATTSFIKTNVVLKVLKSMLKQAVETVKQMDVALTNMAVVTGKSREQVRQYVPALRDLALATSTTLTDVANLTAEYVRQGRTMSDSITLAEQTAKAAKIAGISVADSMKYMTSAINGFNLEAKEALRVNDLFAKLGADSATDYEQLAVALSKVSAQANTAGMSIEFTTALLAKGIETTQEAPESIGTALKTIVARMREITDYGDSLDFSAPINKVEAALRSAGVSLRDSAGQFKDLEEVFNELGPKWDQLNTMQQQAIAQAVAGTRQQSRFLAIMQDWDRTLELSKSATDSLGASTYQYNQVANSLESALTNLSTAWQGLIQNFANTDLIIGLANVLSDVLNVVVSLMEKLNSLSIPGIGDGMLGTAALLITAILTIKDLWVKFQEHQNRTVDLLRTQSETLNKIAEQGMSAEELEKRKQQQITDQNNLLQTQLSLTEKIQLANEEMERNRAEAQGIKAQQEEYTRSEQERLQLIRDREDAETQLQKHAKKLERERVKEEKKAKKDAWKALSKEEKAAIKKKKKEDKKAQKDKKKEEKTVRKEKKKQEKDEKKQMKAKVKERKESRKTELLQEQENIKQRTVTEEAAHKKNMENLQEQYKGQEETEAYKTAIAAEEKRHGDEMTAIDNQQKQLEQDKLTLSQANAVTDTGDLVVQEKKKKTLKDHTKELAKQTGHLLKNVGLSITEAIANAAKAAAQMAIPAALMALAVLATAGISAAVSGIKNASGDNSEKISANQDKIYENKEKYTKIDALSKEYQELMYKQQAGTLSTEERDRMKEIEEELKEIDEDITGTGQALLDSAEKQSKELKEENKKLITENYNMIKANTGGLTADQIQTGAAQYAELQLQNIEGWGNLTDEQRAAIGNEQADIMAGFDYEEYQKVLENNSGWDKFWGTGDAKAAEEWGKALDEITSLSGTLAKDMNAARAQEGENLQAQIDAYTQAMSKATTDQAKEAIKGAYGTLDVLSNVPKEVISNINKEMNSAEVLELTARLTALGNTAGSVAAILDTLSQNMNKFGDEAGKVATYADMLSWSDADWEKNFMGDAEEGSEEYEARKKQIEQMKADGSWESYKTQTKDSLRTSLAGYDVTQTMDRVTSHQQSQKDTADIISALADGDDLDNDQLQTLTAEYGDLMANPEFIEALKNDKSKASQMLAEQQEKQAQQQVDSYKVGQGTIMEDIKASENKLATLDPNSEAYQQELEKLKQLKAQYNANEIAIASLAQQYTKIDEYANSTAKNEAIISDIQKEIERNGRGTLDQYSKMVDAQQALLDLNQKELTQKWENMKATMGITGSMEDYYDIVDGQIIPNAEKMSKLTDRQRGYLIDNVESMQEYSDAILEAQEAMADLVEEQRENAIGIQDEAIAAMKARLEAEYDATKESLDKRQELYEKYFDALEQEEDTESYEQDRQALLNKIAALSTASDSESLAKLKEAQEALAELDEEQLQSERDLRREAVEESFEKQGENLDAAYENAMNNVEGLWQEFVNMQKEDQEALFKQYGDEFQNVTALAAEVAAENLSHFLDAVEGRGIIEPDGTVRKYAEGGLVNYTGPAWVDGTPSKPEAFLDAVDTANIANLAQGLRAMMISNFGFTNSKDSNTVTINELNINVNGSTDGQAIGQGAADGFMKAIRDLGININKKD